ncbi:MAG: ribbon-helix-helix domain-containing protein [Gemmatimonadaceae bacterium]
MWCMAKPSRRAAKDDSAPRLSITLPREEYDELQRLAVNQRVSLAWIVRDALTTYLLGKKPGARNRPSSNPSASR